MFRSVPRPSDLSLNGFVGLGHAQPSQGRKFPGRLTWQSFCCPQKLGVFFLHPLESTRCHSGHYAPIIPASTQRVHISSSILSFWTRDTLDEVSRPRKYCARRMYVALASRTLQDGVDGRDGGFWGARGILVWELCNGSYETHNWRVSENMHSWCWPIWPICNTFYVVEVCIGSLKQTHSFLRKWPTIQTIATCLCESWHAQVVGLFVKNCNTLRGSFYMEENMKPVALFFSLNSLCRGSYFKSRGGSSPYFLVFAGGVWSRMWLQGIVGVCRLWCCWRCLVAELAGRCWWGCDIGCWWRCLIAGRCCGGVLLLVVYDWYVVGMCCGRMVWHIWLGVAAWGVFVSLTSLISLLQVRRASGICVNNYDSVIW